MQNYGIKEIFISNIIIYYQRYQYVIIFFSNKSR